MKERPILFSATMVVALLAGTKTQTRRMVKPAPTFHGAGDGFAPGWAARGRRKGLELKAWAAESFGHQLLTTFGCPYGERGDHLWVKETFVYRHKHDRFYYRADHPKFDPYAHNGWKPSIHMPRRASRITLEITEVRAERLQDISEVDAVAEGVAPAMYSESWSAYDPLTEGYPEFGVEPTAEEIAKHGYENVRHHKPKEISSARQQYSYLWDSINGPASWLANPWVWALTFRRLP